MEKVLIGFETKPSTKRFPLTTDDLTPPGTHKKTETIDKWRGEQEPMIDQIAASQPYTGTLKSVTALVVSRGGGAASLDAIEIDDSSGSKLVSVRFLIELLKRFPGAWRNTSGYGSSAPGVVLIGFRPQLLLQIVAVEASHPDNQPKTKGKVLYAPLSMWTNSSAYRDITTAVMPGVINHVSLKRVLKSRGVDVQNWEGPGNNSGRDAEIALEIAGQMGLLREDPRESSLEALKHLITNMMETRADGKGNDS